MEAFVFNVSLVEMFENAVEKGTAVTRGLCHTHRRVHVHAHALTAGPTSKCVKPRSTFAVRRLQLQEKTGT